MAVRLRAQPDAVRPSVAAQRLNSVARAADIPLDYHPSDYRGP